MNKPIDLLFCKVPRQMLLYTLEKVAFTKSQFARDTNRLLEEHGILKQLPQRQDKREKYYTLTDKGLTIAMLLKQVEEVFSDEADAGND